MDRDAGPPGLGGGDGRMRRDAAPPLPRRRLWWTAVAALWVAAAGMGAAAALPLDCSPAAGGQCLRRAEAGELS
ncbi:MAG: hypothetical protein M3R46_00320 [Actinomycetota bacterium]|nr:hypothetical protein [Actinomycetota bacterium]